MEECEYPTFIAGLRYTFDKSKFVKPAQPKEVIRDAMFATGPEKVVYNVQYLPVNVIPPFPKPPLSTDPKLESYVRYQYQLMRWRRALWDFQKRVTLPVPLGFSVMRPRNPELIPREVLMDKSKLKRMLTRYNVASSPLGPDNQLHLEELLASGKPFSGQSAFPETGLDGNPVTYESHLAQHKTWESELIPVRPEPHLYATFTEYEEAMMRWAVVVMKSNVPILIDAQYVGRLAGLGKSAEHANIAPPPPPPPDEIEESTPMWKGTVNEAKIMEPIHKLMDAYMKASRNPGSDLQVKTQWRSYVPMHACDVTPTRVVDHYQKFGVPYWSATEQSMSLIRRKERAISDMGLMASPEMTNVSIPMDMRQTWLRRYVMEDPAKLLLVDFTPYDFDYLVRSVIQGRVGKSSTIGGYIIEKMSIVRLISLSYFSQDARFAVRMSILMNYVLQSPAWYDELLALDMEMLDRFIELVLCPGQKSHPVPTLPVHEVEAAVLSASGKGEEIQQLATVFKQAQLVVALRDLVFASGDRFYPFFRVMKSLVTNLCVKIASILNNDDLTDVIIKGFLAPKPRERQTFYYRIIKTAILLDSQMILRILSRKPWLKNICAGIASKDRITISYSKSLWQLMSHTSAEVVLKEQFVATPPSSFIDLFLTTTPMARIFLMRVVKSFRNVSNTCEYIPISLEQYSQYLNVLRQSGKDRNVSLLLSCFIDLLKDDDCIGAREAEQIYAVVNKFAEIWAPGLIGNANMHDVRSLKTLCRFRFLSQSVITNADLWREILRIMNSSPEGGRYQLLKRSWQAFENSMLNQAGFFAFLETSQLVQPAITAFTNPPRLGQHFPLKTLVVFARAVNEMDPTDVVAKNLESIFEVLASPEVPFGQRLLDLYNQVGGVLNCRSLVNQFIAELIKARGESHFRDFLARRHMEGPIGTIIKSVKQIPCFV